MSATSFRSEAEGPIADKAPFAELDYSIDWSGWLAPGEIISNVDWDVPAELTNPSPATNTDTITTVWLAGGVAGKTYTITCKITTNQSPPRKEQRSFRLLVRER